MKERLEAIKEETIAKIKNAEDLNILNDIRVEILGKKGGKNQNYQHNYNMPLMVKPKVLPLVLRR